jgi:hypothetical protein
MTETRAACRAASGIKIAPSVRIDPRSAAEPLPFNCPRIVPELSSATVYSRRFPLFGSSRKWLYPCASSTGCDVDLHGFLSSNPVGDATTGSPFATRSKRAPGPGARAVAVFAKQSHLPPATITLHGRAGRGGQTGETHWSCAHRYSGLGNSSPCGLALANRSSTARTASREPSRMKPARIGPGLPSWSFRPLP